MTPLNSADLKAELTKRIELTTEKNCGQKNVQVLWRHRTKFIKAKRINLNLFLCMQKRKLNATKYSHLHITHGLLQPCRHQSICKICPFGKDNYFSLQMHRNSYLYLNISVENGSKTAEVNRENVICKWLTRTEKLHLDIETHFS